MNRSNLALTTSAFFLFVTGACSTTHQVTRPSSLESFAVIVQTEGPIDVVVAPERANEAASNDADSSAAFGGRQPGRMRLLGVAPDGLSVAGRGAPALVTLSDVREYDVTRHGEGAIEGLGIGLLAGVTAGALLGFSAGDDPPCNSNELFGCLFHETAGDKALIGGVVGGLMGMVSGVLIGALVGHTDHYVF